MDAGQRPRFRRRKTEEATACRPADTVPRASATISDLYEYDLEKGELEERLSRGQAPCPSQRSSIDPLVRSMGGRQAMNEMLQKNGIPAEQAFENIYCVQRRDGRCFLSRLEATRRTRRLWTIVHAHSPAWRRSPSVTSRGARDRRRGQARRAAPGESPSSWERRRTWTASSHRQRQQPQPAALAGRRKAPVHPVNGKETSSLASIFAGHEQRTGVLEDPRLSGTAASSTSPPTAGRYSITYFSGRGEEIARSTTCMDPALAHWKLPLQREFPQPRPAAADSGSRSRAYRFRSATCCRIGGRRHCAADGDEIQAGIITGGQDALGIHSYRPGGLFRLFQPSAQPAAALCL